MVSDYSYFLCKGRDDIRNVRVLRQFGAVWIFSSYILKIVKLSVLGQ